MYKKFLIEVVAVAIIFLYWQASRPVTLTIGIFAGSNWNVPQGDKKEDYSEWLAERFIAGEEPDVFFVLAEDFNLYASIGALMNLENLIADDENFSADVYYPSAFKLTKEGVALPENDWTWTDFLAICRKVTRDTDGKGKTSYFADFSMEEAIKFLIELRRLNNGFEVSPKDFDMGRVAFRPFTFAEYRTYKPYPCLKKIFLLRVGLRRMPACSSGGNISVMDSLLVGISSQTRNKDLAWALMKKFVTYKFEFGSRNFLMGFK